MPAAAPIPRSPSVLTLYSAADLLTGRGCPVCRYAGEASDRYFAWFALEAHAQASTITRLCRTLGMCPRHTRRLMSQPGAAARLTAIYRYLVGAARDQLAGRGLRPARCLACERDDSAERRALDTLLEGLTDGSVRERYRDLGGLCIPHLRAAMPRARHQLVTWLTDTMMAAVDAPWPGPGWLAGTDHDAEARAVLRKAISAGAPPSTDVCVACLAAARFESEHLARTLRDHGRRDHRLLVCASHLSDLAVLSGRGGIAALLAWQGGCLTVGAAKRSALTSRWKPGNLGIWPRSWRRPVGGSGSCPVCTGREDAAAQRLDDFRELLRTREPELRQRAPLCVRHQLTLRASDPSAGQMTAHGAVAHANTLIDELNEAFRKGMHAHRHEARGREMTAWRRAAAFLDGGVFCGSTPGET
jgi:hypothetical protein